ncbi:MAG: glycerate kinase, partial [Flavobacteriaceae bacterium]
MHFLLIPDKFKGSVSAEGVIDALTKGILKVIPAAKISTVMASDGGDGFLQAVSQYTEAKAIKTQTVDPLGRELNTSYLFDEVSKHAFIEMAKASGMVLLESSERNPLYTSTYGTGLQILDAINKGAKAIYIGLGGSATNDGGIGIAKALGYFF